MPMQAETAVCQTRADRMSNTHQEKKQNLGGGQKKSGLWEDKLGRDVNPAKIC